MALYELEEMKASCVAAGRAPETLYKTGFTLGCVLRPGEDAGSPRARAQAGPLAVVLFHGVIEGTIKGADAAARSCRPRQRSTAGSTRRYEPADARYLRLHTGHLMFVRPEEERFLSAELIRMSTFTAERDELVERVRHAARRGLPAARRPARPRPRGRHGRLDGGLQPRLSAGRPPPGAASTGIPSVGVGW